MAFVSGIDQLMNMTLAIYRFPDYMPKQNNSNDCGIFAMMVASQLGGSHGLEGIKHESMTEMRLQLATCLIKNKWPGYIIGKEPQPDLHTSLPAKNTSPWTFKFDETCS